MSLDEILPYAMKRTHFKARQVLGKNGFTESDFHDLRQDLLADILARLPKFDGDRAGMKTFVCRLIDNHIASVIRHRQAACRDHRRNESSLNDWVHDEDGTWTRRGATITEDEAWAAVGWAGRPREEQLELVLDTAAMLDGLPDDLRDLCIRLKTQTVVEISRETGVPRTRLYARLKALDHKFRAAGIHHYL
ncbi:MAG: sigma-70 family RNA polymerase sigma factor [Planctomycetes bacterium]|nr:sigma-70 family RNA polymerase sigma factor [Planctomycetota bacterium]